MGSPSFNLARKIKALQDDLKKWNKEEFGDLASRKKSLLSEQDLDARKDLLGLSSEEQIHCTQIKGDIELLAFLEGTRDKCLMLCL